MTEEHPVAEPIPQEELTAYAGRWVAVADGRVYVSTQEGQILCFGS